MVFQWYCCCCVGVVLRLALPVSVFLMIVGFSFWADVDKRVDVTLQMLLVVAALYLGTQLLFGRLKHVMKALFICISYSAFIRMYVWQDRMFVLMLVGKRISPLFSHLSFHLVFFFI
jgi:hypothetical protein